MNKRHGIVPTDRGTFLCATVATGPKGTKISRVWEWNSESFINNYLLLHTPFSLGLPAFWTDRAPLVDSGDFHSATTRTGSTITTNKAEYDHFTELLEHNCIAAYPQDAYLATVPLHFSKQVPSSFVAIAFEDPALKIGIVVDKQLIAVYTIVVRTSAELEGFIGRIERTWHKNNSAVSFPFARCILNELPLDSTLHNATMVDCGIADISLLRAAGCALSSGEAIPRFDARQKRHPGVLRTIALALSLIALVSIGGTTAGLYAYVKIYADKVSTVKLHYQKILNGNTEIRQLIARGNLLAGQILHSSEQMSHPTTWGKFLHLLGTTRPDGMYFERCGTEPLQDNTSAIRVAIAGWCVNETLATDFIKKISKSSLLHNVSLSSLERIPKQEGSCTFKILCVLSLSEK